MKNKKILIIIAIILAVTAVYFYITRYHSTTEVKQEIYTAEDFPSALEKMDQVILNKSLLDLNDQYEKLNDPNDEYTYIRWINIGILKKRLADNIGAEDAWQEAIKYNSDQPLAYGNLADLYLYNMQEYEKAEEYYNKVLVMRPDNFGYYVGLSALYRYDMTEKANLIEGLMLQGAESNPAEAENYYMYLSDYFYREGKDISKSKYYKQQTLEIDPELEDQLPDYDAL